MIYLNSSSSILLDSFNPPAGVQGINNVFHIVNKVDLINNVEYVVYVLYSSLGFQLVFSAS
jgi:hypothetical protein